MRTPFLLSKASANWRLPAAGRPASRRRDWGQFDSLSECSSLSL